MLHRLEHSFTSCWHSSHAGGLPGRGGRRRAVHACWFPPRNRFPAAALSSITGQGSARRRRWLRDRSRSRLHMQGSVTMEYRGLEYAVVQTLSPHGWLWWVKHGYAEKVGMCPNRQQAIHRAKRFIDQLAPPAPP